MKKVRFGQIVTVKHILGETAERLVTRLDDGRYRFNCDAYVEGERCKGGFFHLRQAREVIPSQKLAWDFEKRWPRLRRALHKAGVKPINVPGGGVPLHYENEIVVCDYSMSGSHYFVVKRSDIGKYLEAYPLDDAGKERAQAYAEAKARAEARAYEEATDPYCIAERLGKRMAETRPEDFGWGEFERVTFLGTDNSTLSVIFAASFTNYYYNQFELAGKVVCEYPEKTGIQYLSGFTAGDLDPRKHYRLKKTGDKEVRLMPASNLADIVRSFGRWMDVFNSPKSIGIDVNKIVNAREVIVELFDKNDSFLKERWVYDVGDDKSHIEYLRNPAEVKYENKEPEWGLEKK